MLRLLQRMKCYNQKYLDDNAANGSEDDDVIVIRKKNGDTVTMRRARDDKSW